MRILIVHNRYDSTWVSGEDMAVDAEDALLRRHGHTVERFERHNDDIAGVLGVFEAAVSAVHNRRAVDDLTDHIRSFRPDVIHLHSLNPLISASAITAAARFDCGIVVTLHNHRQVCSGGMLVRDGEPCTKCVGSNPLPALQHGCYRNSRLATFPLVLGHTVHRRQGTWNRVHRFICPSEPVRQRHIEGGFPEARLVVKPHFLDPMPDVATASNGPALYVGRLDVPKGVRHLMSAWRYLPDQPLEIVGDGPLRRSIGQSEVVRRDNVSLLGQLSRPETLLQIARAGFLVIPSLAAETFSLVMAEAMSMGKPIVASDRGAPASILEHGRTGLLYNPGDDDALIDAVQRLDRSPDLAETMGREARELAEELLDPERNHRELIDIYEQAIEEASQ